VVAAGLFCTVEAEPVEIDAVVPGGYRARSARPPSSSPRVRSYRPRWGWSGALLLRGPPVAPSHTTRVDP